jgi:hypothetical protein
MEEHIVSLTQTETNNIIMTKAMRSPGQKPRVAKVDPPVLDLDAAATIPPSSDEPLLIANPRRFVLFPVEHHDVMAMTKKAKWIMRNQKTMQFSTSKQHLKN